MLVTRAIPDAGLALLRDSCNLTLRSDSLPPTKSELIAQIADYDGLICLVTDPIDAEVLAAATRLRVVSIMAVGYNNIDVATASRLGIAVGNTPDVLTDATADMAFALLIGAARCVRPGLDNIAQRAWRTWEPLGFLGQELTEKTLGIVGMGRIGMALARRCAAGWGMNIIYHSPHRSERAERELAARAVGMEELLDASDFVSLHCPQTAANRHLIGREQFRRMKSTAVFINTARGGLVDQTALRQALEERWIFAAGIDVTDPEPPDPDDPLLRLPNLVVLPHIGSATVEARNRMSIMAAENLLAGLTGQPLPNWVNPQMEMRRSKPIEL